MTYNLRKREETTTDTEEAAIAADAIQGFSDRPHGTNTPATKPHSHHSVRLGDTTLLPLAFLANATEFEQLEIKYSVKCALQNSSKHKWKSEFQATGNWCKRHAIHFDRSTCECGNLWCLHASGRGDCNICTCVKAVSDFCQKSGTSGSTHLLIQVACPKKQTGSVQQFFGTTPLQPFPLHQTNTCSNSNTSTTKFTASALSDILVPHLGQSPPRHLVLIKHGFYMQNKMDRAFCNTVPGFEMLL